MVWRKTGFSSDEQDALDLVPVTTCDPKKIPTAGKLHQPTLAKLVRVNFPLPQSGGGSQNSGVLPLQRRQMPDSHNVSSDAPCSGSTTAPHRAPL
ncbi:hypothetical protein JCM18909_3430 [Cutibacterium acnes JCM 18909]|nr:hypothetical protein JCM18909_3430 [Cutibacterium acnes JCM 18909]